MHENKNRTPTSIALKKYAICIIYFFHIFHNGEMGGTDPLYNHTYTLPSFSRWQACPLKRQIRSQSMWLTYIRGVRYRHGGGDCIFFYVKFLLVNIELMCMHECAIMWVNVLLSLCGCDMSYMWCWLSRLTLTAGSHSFDLKQRIWPSAILSALCYHVTVCSSDAVTMRTIPENVSSIKVFELNHTLSI